MSPNTRSSHDSQQDLDSSQLCTCFVDGLLVGVDVLAIQEVIRTSAMTRVPRAPRSVVGLINLRGQIVTALDLRDRLGLPPAPPPARAPSADDPADGEPEGRFAIVVRTKEGPVGLIVDRIGDVIDVDPARREPPPPNLPGPWRRIVADVFKLDDALLMRLDIARAVDVKTEVAPSASPTPAGQADISTDGLSAAMLAIRPRGGRVH
jgi:purine-binding chemotaxis protein CheW